MLGLYEYTLSTVSNNFYDITAKVRDAVAQSVVKSGIAVAYCPHTTAGITMEVLC